MVFSQPLNASETSTYHIRRLAALIFGSILILESILVLLAWHTGFQSNISLQPGHPEMKGNTVLGFILLGIALLSHLGQNLSRLEQIIGITICFIFTLTLLEYALDVDMHIDTLLFTNPSAMSDLARPSVATTYSFIAASFLLIFKPKTLRKYFRLTTTVIVSGSALPLIGLFTFLYNPKNTTNLDPFSTMNIHTAFGFAVFYFAASLIKKDLTILHIFADKTPGSYYFRRIFISIIATPFIFSIIIQQMVSYNLIDPHTGLAIFSVFFLFISLIVLTWNANRENNLYKRIHAENESKLEAQLTLSLVLDAAQGAIFLFNQDGSIRSLNQGAARIFGWTYEEMQNMKLDDFIPPRLREIHRSHMQHFKSTNISTRTNNDLLRMVGYRKDGSEFPILVTIAKYKIDGEMFFGAVIFEAQQLANQMHQLETESTIDPLTGIYNRRSLDKTLHELNKHGARRQSEYGLMILDIDHFKQINDQYGHEAGDHIVVEFTKRVQKTLREGDKLFRYGGDEFVILALCNTADQAQELGKRIQTSIAQYPVQHDNTEIHITCSIGISMLPSHCTDVEACFKSADTALYKAKEAGRNQTILHPI